MLKLTLVILSALFLLSEVSTSDAGVVYYAAFSHNDYDQKTPLWTAVDQVSMALSKHRCGVKQKNFLKKAVRDNREIRNISNFGRES